MEETIIGVIGATLGAAGLILFIKSLLFKLGSAETVGEIVSSRQDDKGRFVHTVRFTVDGKEYCCEDSAGFSRALDKGSELLISYSKTVPTQFRFAREMRTSLLAFGLLALMGAAFAVRFLIF